MFHGGKIFSRYTFPLIFRLLAIACKIHCGCKSHARPIRKYNEPGCITIIISA